LESEMWTAFLSSVDIGERMKRTNRKMEVFVI
jgi:hypothetical protein